MVPMYATRFIRSLVSCSKRSSQTLLMWLKALALISVVGRNMSRRAGTSGRIFGALGEAGVNIRMITQSPQEISIILGVDNKDFERAIRVIYDKFADEMVSTIE